ncbi:MAG TPA: AAA family ATPase [Bacillota bacterium]|nr:AAA family ATPase [Bacillota bacterium]
MRIKNINLSGFGRFRNYQLDIDQPITIIAGKNEAGKTTMVNAIAAILFGFTGPRRDLHRRYAPWSDARSFRASLMIETDEGIEYLVGRDFASGRMEIFRCEGIRLEPVDDSILQKLIENEIGINNANLFEHTFLIRENEVSLLEKDPHSRESLSGMIGRRLAGSGSTATVGEAVHTLEEQLKNLIEGEETFPGGLSALKTQIDELKKQYQLEQENFFKSLVCQKEFDRINQSITFLDDRIKSLKESFANQQTEVNPQVVLDEVRQRIQHLAAEHERLTRIKEEETRRRLRPTIETTRLSDEVLRQCEEILKRLSAFEVEEKYRSEQISGSRDSNGALEREAQQLREKMKALGEWRSDPDLQTQISTLLLKVNEAQKYQLELTKKVTSGEKSVQGGVRLAVFLLVLFFLGTAGSATALVLNLLANTIVYGIAAVSGVSLVASIISFASVGHHKNSVKRDQEELGQREDESLLLQGELSKILHGKSIEDYRRENEVYRLYQNDLWHLENTINQQQSMGNMDSIGSMGSLGGLDNGDNLKSMRDEKLMLYNKMRDLLIPYGDDLPVSSWRDIVDGERRLRKGAEDREKEEIPAESWRESDLIAIRQELEHLHDEERRLEQDLSERKNLSIHEDEINKLESQRQAFEVEKARKEAEYALLNQSEQKDIWDLANTIADREDLLSRLTEEEGSLRFALDLMKTANEESAGQIGPELERLTGEYLGTMTHQRYNRIQLEVTDNDITVRVMAPETQEFINPNMLSAGSLDQVYFAFRVALAQVLAKGRSYPLFLDDPFQHFDRERLDGAVELLKEVANDHQIIWWTKDLETAESFADVDKKILEK